MSRIIDLTLTLKLELADQLSRAELYDNLESMLRTGLGEILVPSGDCVTIIAANDPASVLSCETNLKPLLTPAGEIAIVWSVEDVLEIRPDLSREQAAEVLEQVSQDHDAGIGINWQTLEYVADELFGDIPERAEAES